MLPLFIQALLYPNPEGSVILLANPGFRSPLLWDALKVSLKANQTHR